MNQSESGRKRRYDVLMIHAVSLPRLAMGVASKDADEGEASRDPRAEYQIHTCDDDEDDNAVNADVT